MINGKNSSIDLVAAWPQHVDFPLWRQFIHDNRSRFEKVIIVFTNMNVPDPDYRLFLREAMKHDDIILLDNDNVRGDQDWRNVAVNKALEHSDSEWVWFTEEDFFVLKPEFWDMIKNMLQVPAWGAVIYDEGERPHPACWFTRRELIDKTSKDFGVVKDKLDHFGKFYEELQELTPINHMGANEYIKHMNGLSQNMHMLQSGDTPNFRPEDFKQYLKDCLKVTVPLDPRFIELVKNYI